jgi:hypothetical protein
MFNDDRSNFVIYPVSLYYKVITKVNALLDPYFNCSHLF